MPIYLGGTGTGPLNVYRVYELTGGTITDNTKEVITLDNNWFYEIVYASTHYDAGNGTGLWRYVRWHAADGSGGSGDVAGDNWHIAVVESSGTNESSDVPTWDVSNSRARITYGNGYASYRSLTIRGSSGDGSDRTGDWN